MSKGTTQIIQFALQSADSFFRLALGAEEYWIKHDDKRLPTDIFPPNVNMSLSVELFLKTIILFGGEEPPYTHDLIDLYNRLGGAEKATAKHKYKSMLRGDPPDESPYPAWRVKVSRDDRDQEDSGEDEEAEDNPELEELLEEHRDTFQVWRYMHEVPKDEGYSHSYNFRAMVAVARALRRIALNEAEEADDTMVWTRHHPDSEEDSEEHEVFALGSLPFDPGDLPDHITKE